MAPGWNWEWVLPLLAAPLIGSFLCVLVRRLPQNRPVVLARSECERCGVPLAARDLVPLLSFAVLRGRCRTCRGVIAAEHWQIELAAVAVAGGALLAGSSPPRLWLDCGLGWVLLALAWIDWRTMRLPDVLTLPLIPAGLFATLWLAPDRAWDHAIAATLGYTASRLLAWAYRRLRGRDGMGEGDAKLLAALGAWTGLEALPDVLLGGALAGLCVAAILYVSGRDMRATTQIPFGPCLALAGWVVRLHS